MQKFDILRHIASTIGIISSKIFVEINVSNCPLNGSLMKFTFVMSVFPNSSNDGASIRNVRATLFDRMLPFHTEVDSNTNKC